MHSQTLTEKLEGGGRMNTPSKTPETDAAWKAAFRATSIDAESIRDFARRLELQRDELLDVLRDIYHDADMWADGAPDAGHHAKFCNELVSKIKPLIQP